jgi:Ca2+-binding RTX toxin-like protein
MAIISISADTSTPITANTSGNIWIVKTNVEVTTTGDVINGTGSNGSKTFLIHGHLIADNGDGIDLGDSVLNNGGGNKVHILSTGSIFAESSAIESAGGGLDLTNEGSLFSSNTTIFAEDGNNAIANTGTITSSISSGISASGANNTIANGGAISAAATGIVAGGGSSEVANTGTITSSASAGIFALGGNNTISNGGAITAGIDGILTLGSGNLIVNSGSVVTSSPSATIAAVRISSLTGETNKLVNSGELSSQLNAVLGGDGNETVVNRGSMNGDVDLGAGNDLFKGWGGTVEGNIRGRGGNDTLIGGNSDDAIFGDFGNDLLKGGDGDDTLTGGNGRDVMRGGLGSDTFDFNKTNESAVGGQRDRIEDFSKVEDFIDLSTIDAKTGAGNQAFDFIGTQGFHGVKGELRATATASGNTIIAGDTDGDASADFQILVQGVTGLTAGDFVL